jgi:hypothetical protein
MKSIDRSVMLGAVLFSLAVSAARVDAQAIVETAKPSKPPKPSSDLITAEQLKSRTFPDVYQAIESLRGHWLRARNLNPPSGALVNPGAAGDPGRTGSGPPASGLGSGGTGMPRDAAGIQVYLDGTRLGGIETLKGLPVVTVYSVRRISGTDAQARFGIGHSDGVLFVATGPDKESR